MINGIRSDHGSTDNGFALIEALVSFVVLIVIATAATTLVISLIVASHTAQLRVAATNIALQDLAEVRDLNTQALATPSVGASITNKSGVQTQVGNASFTLTRSVQIYATGSAGDAPVSGTACSPSQYRLVTTTVTWVGAKRPVTISTRLGC